MRRLLRTCDLGELGFTDDAIRWGVRSGRWTRVESGVYVEGADEPAVLERAAALAIATCGVASGSLAGVLLELDSVELRPPYVTVPRSQSNRRGGVRRRTLPPGCVIVVDGLRCTNGAQTLVDLATVMTDLQWEHALESALRRRLVQLAELRVAALGPRRGAARMRSVLALRPPGTPPTESVLETRMVQLARTVPGLEPPSRQLNVNNAYGELVGRVDLAWPELGLFVELDGQHHRGQPLYDARRETAIVAATGWLCGRFTWREVVHLPVVTARRLRQLAEQARRRPVARFSV